MPDEIKLKIAEIQPDENNLMTAATPQTTINEGEKIEETAVTETKEPAAEKKEDEFKLTD
jgi:hypothetical protein